VLAAVIIAAADFAVRFRQLSAWSPQQWLWYASSAAYAMLWTRLCLWLLGALGRRGRWAAWALAIVLGAINAFVLVTHFNHYLYFGVQPEVISFSQFLGETRETLRVIAAVLTPLNQVLLALLTAALAALWRPGAQGPAASWKRAAAVGTALLLAPVFHNNVQWGRGNFYPAVNFTFAATKAAQFHLAGRDFRRLPLARRPAPAPRTAPLEYNLLVLVSESVRAKSVSYLGYGRATTPRQAAFLASRPDRVFVFPRCYTNSIHTNPSVPSLLSGVHPLEFPGKLAEAPLLYEYAAAFPGTRTFLFSAQAFEAYNFQDFFRSPYLERFVYQENSGHPPFNFGGMDDRYLTPLVGQVLADLKPGQRFAGIVHFNGTHHPYTMAEGSGVWGRYSAADLYDNAVHYQDGVIGALFDLLAKAGQLDNTVILFTSDHGEGMGEHGISGHRRGYYEEFIHVPCWMVLPAPLAARRGGALRANAARSVSNVDWAPTLVDLLGMGGQTDGRELPAHLDGRSLARPLPPERTIVVHNGLTNVRVLQGFAVLHGSESLLHIPAGDSGALELFDLATDPEQRRNLWPTLGAGERGRWIERINSYPQLREELRRAPPP
jgi:glucan phosphoethanolaminetransferase (alkaline phosphatase superfamily)